MVTPRLVASRESSRVYASKYARLFDLITTPQGVREHAAEVIKSREPHLLRMLATSPYTPPTVLADLARLGDRWLQELVEHHVRLPSEARAYLTEQRCEREYSEFVWSGLNRLEWLQSSTAPGALLDAEALRSLRRDYGDAVEVAMEIAREPRVPPRVLAALARHDDPRVRRCVAWNPSAGRRLLDRLSRDGDQWVRYAVAQHDAVDVKTLKVLSSDEWSDVRKEAEERLTARTPRPLFTASIAFRQPSCARLGEAGYDAAATDEVASAQFVPESVHPGEELPETLVVPPLLLSSSVTTSFKDTRSATDLLAVQAVVHLERSRGHEPVVMPHSNEGFDISSSVPGGAELMIEVKGAGPTARSVQITRAQLDLAASAADRYVLAVVTNDGRNPRTLLWWQDPLPGRLPPLFSAVELDLAEVRRNALHVELRVAVSADAEYGALFTT